MKMKQIFLFQLNPEKEFFRVVNDRAIREV
jgi:hypothetical protein